MKKYIFKILTLLIVFSFVFTPLPINAFYIWIEGGNIGSYLHFYAWEGFSDATKRQFDLAFDEWNIKAGHVKPASLWLDRSGTDTTQTERFVANSKNEITKTYQGTSVDSYLMATNPTRFMYIYGEKYLVEVDIDINGSMPWSNSVNSTTYFVQDSFTHEVGHAYGLYEVDYYSSVKPTMYQGGIKGSNERCTIENDDILGIDWIY